jgi:hypothetical protein
MNLPINKWTVLAIMIVALIIYIKMTPTVTKEKSQCGGNSCSAPQKIEKFESDLSISNKTENVGVCSSKKGCGENKNLLPIMNPLFNMREICKQCILLEDHLFQKRKRCDDCIKKHCLTIEGLAEEAITLDKDKQYNLDKLGLADQFRTIQTRYLSGEDPVDIAQTLRQIRKPLMNKYFDQF